MVLDYRDKVLAFIRSKGPVLPVHISKEVGTNILMASAMLSELVSKGSLKVSGLKVGGSPLYFIPGQEPMLMNFLASLNEKDRRTLELLQQQKIIRDTSQEAITRVSLRQLKDFAYPLNVTHDGITEIFWKWHQLTDADASNIIRSILEPQAPVQQAPLQSTHLAQPAPVKRPRVKKVKPEVAQVAAPPVSIPQASFAQAQPVRDVPRQTSSVQVPQSVPVAQQVLEDPALTDAFFQQLQGFCSKSNIKILEYVMVKKKQDYDLVLEIPSPVGSLIYYAKARNKSKLTDADLNAAFIQGQLKKLPAALFAPGELNKKGQELLAKDLRGLIFARVA